MEYALLIYESENDMEIRNDPAKAPAYWASWMGFSQMLIDAGVMRGGNGLELPSTATRVALRDGKRVVQDGPFITSKEQFGGYFVIETPDLETALGYAAKCPAAPHGWVEVRPVMASRRGG